MPGGGRGGVGILLPAAAEAAAVPGRDPTPAALFRLVPVIINFAFPEIDLGVAW